MACEPNRQFNKRISPEDAIWFKREKVRGEESLSSAELFSRMRQAYELIGYGDPKLSDRENGSGEQAADRRQPVGSTEASDEAECSPVQSGRTIVTRSLR
jgi:hypothetical protein